MIKKQALKSVWEASEYFSNIGIDLIYGIPALKKILFLISLLLLKNFLLNILSIYEFNIKNREIQTLKIVILLKNLAKY